MRKAPLRTNTEHLRNKNVSFQSIQHLHLLPICFIFGLLCYVATSCKKEAASSEFTLKDNKTHSKYQSEDGPHFNDGSLSPQTVRELKDARAATARYQNIKNAISDGYADINVVRPEMGYHYMKSDLVDASFEATRPELLVYNKTEKGKMELVALEYAVPISFSPNAAPLGFTGDADIWKYDTEFGLWLLHAWVWEHNPAGVFNPTNPNVHVH